MPSYDLVCKSCDHAFEVTLQRFLTDADKVCPECGSTEVEQSLTQFEFRGTPYRPIKGQAPPVRSTARFPPKKKSQ
jgi:putative FmdB family regulatory protein